MLTGDDREGIDAESTPILTLLPFAEPQIRNYLTSVFDGDTTRAEAAFDLIASIHNLGELASRPYLLSLIAHRLEEFEEIRTRGGAVNAARLYQLFTQRWLSRDDGKHSLDPVHKRQLMEQLAVDLWRRGEKELDPDELELWLDRYLLDHPEVKGAYDGIESVVLKEDLRTACFVLRQDDPPVAGASEGTPNLDRRSSFRFAHTSLHEFFLAAWIWHRLKQGSPDALDLPQVSVETLDFLGQILQLEPERYRVSALKQMSAHLEGDCLQAATLAFRYWMRAVDQGLPVPQPKRVNLTGANLEDSVIRGHGPDQKLNLRGAVLFCTKLNRLRMQWVDLTGARLEKSELRQAVLSEVTAARTNWTGADLSGLKWRGGSLDGACLRDTVSRCELVHVSLVDTELSSDWEGRVQSMGGDRSADRPAWFLGHSNSVLSCAWSPDGESLLSASGDNTLKVWDAVSGECRQTSVQLPEFGWATLDEREARWRCASSEAWRWLGWLVPGTNGPQRVSLETFGSVPGLDRPSV